jgi:PilZ domain-containing protein
MRRLREHQLVTLELERPSASIDCHVVAIEGNEATLAPVSADDLMQLPIEGKDALLTFHFRSQLITLRGAGRRDPFGRDLRFTVTDRVTVPQRRRYARVPVGLTVALTPPGGSQLDTRTRDVSADGVLVEAPLEGSAGSTWHMVLDVPDNGPPIVCDSQFVRHVGGGTALRFAGIATGDRERLKQFVAARKRAILARARNRAG